MRKPADAAVEIRPLDDPRLDSRRAKRLDELRMKRACDQNLAHLRRPRAEKRLHRVSATGDVARCSRALRCMFYSPTGVG